MRSLIPFPLANILDLDRPATDSDLSAAKSRQRGLNQHTNGLILWQYFPK